MLAKMWNSLFVGKKKLEAFEALPRALNGEVWSQEFMHRNGGLRRIQLCARKVGGLEDAWNIWLCEHTPGGVENSAPPRQEKLASGLPALIRAMRDFDIEMKAEGHRPIRANGGNYRIYARDLGMGVRDDGGVYPVALDRPMMQEAFLTEKHFEAARRRDAEKRVFRSWDDIYAFAEEKVKSCRWTGLATCSAWPGFLVNGRRMMGQFSPEKIDDLEKGRRGIRIEGPSGYPQDCHGPFMQTLSDTALMIHQLRAAAILYERQVDRMPMDTSVLRIIGMLHEHARDIAIDRLGLDAESAKALAGIAGLGVPAPRLTPLELILSGVTWPTQDTAPRKRPAPQDPGPGADVKR